MHLHAFTGEVYGVFSKSFYSFALIWSFDEKFDFRKLFLESLQQLYKKNAIFVSHVNLLEALAEVDWLCLAFYQLVICYSPRPMLYWKKLLTLA